MFPYRVSYFPLLALAIGLSLPACVAQPNQGTSAGPPTNTTPENDSKPDPNALPDPPMTHSSADAEGQQTRRILGIMPNFRSVSVDQTLPPLSSREKLKLTLQDSFDYSSFVFVGILAGISQAEDSYPEFHGGAPAYARYYWHSYADTLNGNLMTEFVVPSATREDPRYYTLGRGGFVKRTGYSVTRLLVTRSDQGGQVPNFSEIVGNGAAAGISGLYYPARYRTWTKTGQRWVMQVSLDGLSNLVKEYWPDLNAKLYHRKN